MVLETGSVLDTEIIVSHDGLKNSGFRVEVPDRRGPRVIVYDEDRTISESDLIEAIIAQKDLLGKLSLNFVTILNIGLNLVGLGRTW